MKQAQSSLWRIYGLAIVLTVGLLAFVLLKGGPGDFIKILILAGLEITFSFDNAIINAKILQRLSYFWQQIFMTVGIAIAVFGVRLVLPLIIVSASAKLSIAKVANLALHDPTTYGQHLQVAHPLIAAFGGVFLLMIFLEFILEDRAVKWFELFERNFARLGKLENISITLALGILLAAAFGFAHGQEQTQVLVAGLIGLLVYLVINAFDSFFSLAKFEQKASATKSIARAGLVGFLYLELIDASFSLDGVVGAFAITNKILLIAAGLGIGALYVRSITVHMLRRGTLSKYRYLEHGAHYAIGILALLLLVSIRYKMPDFVSGGAGILFIGTAIIDSYMEARHEKQVAS